MANNILDKYKTFPNHLITNKIKILNEFLLIINLINVPGNRISVIQIEKIFNKYSGDCALHNWTDLKIELIAYMSANEDKDYGRSLIENTGLRIITEQYTNRTVFLQKLLLGYLPDMRLEHNDLKDMCNYFTYYIFSDWHEYFFNPTCHNTIREILYYFATLFTPPSELANSYIDYRIWVTDIKSFNSLVYLREDLVPNIIDLEHFKIRFYEIYYKQYDECIAQHQ